MPLSHRHTAASLRITQGGRFAFAMIAGRKSASPLVQQTSALGMQRIFYCSSSKSHSYVPQVAFTSAEASKGLCGRPLQFFAPIPIVVWK